MYVLPMLATPESDESVSSLTDQSIEQSANPALDGLHSHLLVSLSSPSTIAPDTK